MEAVPTEYRVAVGAYLELARLRAVQTTVPPPKMRAAAASASTAVQKESKTPPAPKAPKPVPQPRAAVATVAPEAPLPATASAAEQGSTLSCLGPAPYQGDILDNPDLVWTDDVWTPERQAAAEEQLRRQGGALSEFWRRKYETQAGMFWHEFYKRNEDNFYKDRHYLHIVFPELLTRADAPVDDANSYHLLEVGCGVGNAVIPLTDLNANLRVVAMDFARSAIQILAQHPLSLSGRVRPFVNNVAADQPPVAAGTMDGVLCMFVLSAIAPAEHSQVMDKLFSVLKPGGKLFLRDYARYDEAQLRFKKGSKLDDNFYVRQDGTCSYFFSTDDLRALASAAGFQVEELDIIQRQYANRQQQKARHRSWAHMKLAKPL